MPTGLGSRPTFSCSITASRSPYAEHAERSGAMVREIAVEIAPATVLRRIDAHHRVALGRHLRAVQLHVMPAAERGRRLATIDRDVLSTSRAQFATDRRRRGRSPR